MSFSAEIRKFFASLHVNVTKQNFSSFVLENETGACLLFKKEHIIIKDKKSGKKKYYKTPRWYKPSFLKLFEANNFSCQTELFDETDVRETSERTQEILKETNIHAPINLLFAIEGKECIYLGVKRTQTIAYYSFEAFIKNKLHISVGNLYSLKNVSKDLEKLHEELAVSKLPVVKPHSLRAILLEPQVVGTLFHEFAHLLEFDRSSQKIRRIIGKKIFDREDLTIVEKPRMESFGFNMITDEGIETRDVTLVENGKLKEPIDSVIFKYNMGSCGYSEAAYELAYPRTVNLYITVDNGESYNNLACNEVAVIKNATILPVNSNPFNVLLDINRIQGILLKDNIPRSIITGNLNLRVKLKDLVEDATFSREKGGGEPGFCVKQGQRVRSTQIAPAALLGKTSSKLFFCAINNLQ
jgi:hypothetical protein